jgi:hypothetical protein
MFRRSSALAGRRHQWRFVLRMRCRVGMTPGDQLARVKSRPMLIESAIRVALQDAIAWRIGGGSAPGATAFATAAVAAARLALDTIDGDSAERSRTLATVQTAARRFAGSPLGRRLMTIPASQFIRIRQSPDGPDALVRDRRRRLHAIALTAQRDAFDAGRIASRVARATPLAIADRLTPLTVHVFSLASGRRHAFARDVFSAHLTRDRVRVA